MLKFFKVVLMLALLLFPAIPPNAAVASGISIETDPVTFPLSGYALHAFYRPEGISRLSIGAGTYSLKLPDIFIGMNSNNSDKGWSARINGGASLFVEYDLTEEKDTPYAGLQLGSQEYRIENGGASSSFAIFLAMLSIGYRWHIAGSEHFYLKPWAGVGYQSKVRGDNCVGAQCYDVQPALGFATFHVGYTF
ncbi:MAG: hypothetical protein HZA03_11470 [Nitrospinae bacterium]|nr:hypothetical protein [Nitrospinota bacterium]